MNTLLCGCIGEAFDTPSSAVSGSGVRPPIRGHPSRIFTSSWLSYHLLSGQSKASVGGGKADCRGQYGSGPVVGQALSHWCLCWPLSLYSSAPKGCTSFGITAPPGVVVDVAHSPPAKKSTTSASKWPLDPELEVTLQVKAASSSTDDQKVDAMTGVRLGSCWVGMGGG